ncbi:flocculation protein FLO11 [Drosophila madeirensis]|uniref:Flocculation protein FLO11 n=1 Tax=Drosophila madeirensis TaxID=30013 RepID=A0AAU9G5G5_DROMD
MSNMKGGLSTLNRWFGRKKDKSGSNKSSSIGNLSKSTTQLHQLSKEMEINEASQLDYNRITPIPAVTSNAPFEQTFRITVLLPKDQLYVARLGARVPMRKLLELVCDNKQLDIDKYEFRSPVDASQVYSCESTIGAVGLSEIRLCHKSESYDSFNGDAMTKFQRQGTARDSLSSSSDFSSSRNSKVTAKTPSPYSSTNSLNSMDSTGMNYTRTPVFVPAKVMAPPPRKKRVAPRPPSQHCIPEQSVPESEPDRAPKSAAEPAYAVIVKRPQLCMSTPNLSAQPPELLDCNGNSAKASPVDTDGHYATLDLKRASGPVRGSITSTLSGQVQGSGQGPEPSPRRRLLQIKKKAAPAPPPGLALAGNVNGNGNGNASGADSISLASTTNSLSETLTPSTPQPAPRITTPLPTVTAAAAPTPAPTPTPTPPNTPVPALPSSAPPTAVSQNVSKVLLNRTPTPEPRSLGSATEEEDNNDAASKQADSGIGEPAPSPSPEPEEPEKSNMESSSEDDEAIKVYNFKLCQTSVKGEQPLANSLAELAVLTAAAQDEDDEEEEEEQQATSSTLATPTSASEQTSLSSWNYSGPISPPPDFSDPHARGGSKSAASSPGSPLDEIVDELSAIIQQQRLDTLIRKQPEQTEIEAAKPNRLTNFSIATAKSSTITSSTTSKKVSRSDSFQAAAAQERASRSLSQRSSSHISLNKIDQNGLGNAAGPRRSSSELSIGETPSLQSFEVIKTILNSRQNSLTESSASASPPPCKEVEQDQPKSSPTAVARLERHAATSGQAKEKATPEPEPSPPPVKALKQPSPPPVKAVKEQQQVAPTAAKTVQEQQPQPQPAPASTLRASPAKEQSATVKAIKEQASPVTSPVALRPATVQTQTEEHFPDTITVITPLKVAAPPAAAAKPLPPQYRYSGPPNINFGAWSERPKSQVAIKNEGDYIFGGAGATPAPAPAKLTIEVASPMLRMGIPLRKEYHVPITVKPLRDVTPPTVAEEATATATAPAPVPAAAPAPSQPQVLSSTLPRPAKSNRFTLPAGGGGGGGGVGASLPRPVSTLERSKAPADPTPAPFGQNTLRRTGFKERMLAREQQDQEKALSARVSVPAPIPVTTAVEVPAAAPTVTAAAPPVPAPKPVPASKPSQMSVLKTSTVELKLQEPEAQPQQTAKFQVKLRSTSGPAAAASRTAATPPPPPPPQMGVSLKPLKAATERAGRSRSAEDPRSQLLDAIRNFKRDELNRS